VLAERPLPVSDDAMRSRGVPLGANPT